jgi:hypothetical protein
MEQFFVAPAMKAHQGPARLPQWGIAKTAAAACALAIFPIFLAKPVAGEAATVTLLPAAGPAGTSTTLNGRGFAAGARVQLRVGKRARASARADGRGRFNAVLRIPKGARGSVRVRTSTGKRPVVNFFRVRPGTTPGAGDVSSQRGAGLRWGPLEGPQGTRLTIALRRFPANRRLTVRLGRTAVAAGRTNRRGKAVRRLKVPNGPRGRLAVKAETRRRSLLFHFLLTAGAPPPSTGSGIGGPGAAGLVRPAIENVTSATAYRYLSRDDKGSTLDTLKVIPSPGGGYLGVYHTLTAGVFVTKLARSTNLLTWNHVVDLEPNASQPTITALSDGGFLVAYEKDAGCTGTGPGGNCLGFRHYAGLASLLAGAGDRSFQAPRTLSRCAEGTPNIYGAELRPDIDHSTIDVGFHYFRNCDVDRQARGTLQNFSSWSGNVAGGLNTAFEAFQPGGNIGDRDFMRLGGGSFNIHEVQFAKGDFGTWRVYLYDWLFGLATPLAIRTHRGSTAFANPTFTTLLSPAGRPAILVTLFIPSQGAAPTEGGELIYYHEIP